MWKFSLYPSNKLVDISQIGWSDAAEYLQLQVKYNFKTVSSKAKRASLAIEKELWAANKPCQCTIKRRNVDSEFRSVSTSKSQLDPFPQVALKLVFSDKSSCKSDQRFVTFSDCTVQK